MNRTIATVIVGAAIIALAGCGGSSTATKPATQPTTTLATTSSASVPPVDHAAQYEKIVGPQNTALDTAKAKISNTATYTLDQLVAIFAPVVTAGTTANDQLLRATWPTNTQDDIKTLVRDNTALLAVLSGSSGTAAGFENAIGPAGAKVAGDVNVVRADLGLPPSS